jgi:signal transduction histidine kinase/DNA-binding response OmpR family regulator
VEGAPHSKFYAGVPIRSPSGHSIGTYCVLDDKPRDGLSEFELCFLKDMATTVMRHLEMTRATDDHKRGGVMVRSLGSFADGRSSVDDWWDPWETDAASPEAAPETITASRPRRSTIGGTAVPPTTLGDGVDPFQRSSVDSSVPSEKLVSPSTGPPVSASVTPATDVVEQRPQAVVATKSSLSVGSDVKSLVSPEVKEIFDRAAQMIVRATDAEGAVFFDAKVSTWGGLVDDESFAEVPPETDKPCAMLGAAYHKGAQTQSSTTDQCSMTENALKHLLRNYSHGQIFNLDEDAASLAQHSNKTGDAAKEELDFFEARNSESTRSTDDEVLLKECFPQARSLVIYPLWDTHRDRWFASVIIWSSDPLRVFTSEQELSFLAAFSNTVMAEVARLDTKLADAAKADFISSISHELRSPLHGILGMTDLLKSTQIDGQQQSQIETIETCGQTLLETINHVLDYAKINNLTRGNSKRGKQRSKSAKPAIDPGQGQTSDTLTIISDVDISTVVEDVLGTVFSGFHYQQALAQKEEYSEKSNSAPIAIIIDTNKSDNYVFRTQPGAWKRIIMNLFGNALKYTDAGFIKVKLQMLPTNNSAEECELRLIVSDSGIGMSEDYVNNRLFTSFAQENPLSQGTGLGLSIVKQLVEHLGGTVEVRSEKGRGTKFTVSCNMRPSTLSPSFGLSTPEQTLVDVKKRTAGLNVHFVGFEDVEDYVLVKSLKDKNAIRVMKKAFENQFADWFDMKVWRHGADNAPDPNLFVTTETGARDLRAQYSRNPGQGLAAPVIVVCRGPASAQSTTAITVPGLLFECISQPCGPHKLAKALASCLDRQANRLLAKSTVTDSPTKTITSKVSQLDLKENAPPARSDAMSRIQESGRPAIASTMSAPEIRSLNTNRARPSTPAHRELKCLAVDDNPINLRLLRTFVNKLGHTHVLARTGLEALNAYKASCTSAPHLSPALAPSDAPSQALTASDTPVASSHIDVILMDINMPEMDGLEATRQIRAHERDMGLSPVTIIALTGLASAEAQQEAHASGVNLFLIKPVRLAELEVVLKGVVTGKEEEVKERDALPEVEEPETKQTLAGELELPDTTAAAEEGKKAVETHGRHKSSIV